MAEPNQLNMREEVSRLVGQLGVTKISGRRFGHYDAERLDEIPADKLNVVYEDLTAICKRRRTA